MWSRYKVFQGIKSDIFAMSYNALGVLTFYPLLSQCLGSSVSGAGFHRHITNTVSSQLFLSSLNRSQIGWDIL